MGKQMNDRLTIRVSPDLLLALERYIVASGAPNISRQEAFRQIARDWLVESGFFQSSINEVIDPGESGVRRVNPSDSS